MTDKILILNNNNIKILYITNFASYSINEYSSSEYYRAFAFFDFRNGLGTNKGVVFMYSL
jgi:hypothetical protein